jgi:hypothetical protein
METKINSEGKGKTGMFRKVLIPLVVIVLIIMLALAARFLVSSVDIVGLLKQIHGG